MLDLCGLAALYEGLSTGSLPPALAVGYSVTALGMLFMVTMCCGQIFAVWVLGFRGEDD